MEIAAIIGTQASDLAEDDSVMQCVGGKKDTLINIEANGEFVINASTEKHADLINMSSKMLLPDESEVEMTGLSTLKSDKVRPPCLAEVLLALECRVLQIIPIGNGAISANLVFGEIVMMHIDAAVLDPKGQPDPRKIRAIVRLGGEF